MAVDAVRAGVELLDHLALAGREEHLVLLGHPALLLHGDVDAVDGERAVVARRQVDPELGLAEHLVVRLRDEAARRSSDCAGVVGLVACR